MWVLEMVAARFSRTRVVSARSSSAHAKQTWSVAPHASRSSVLISHQSLSLPHTIILAHPLRETEKTWGEAHENGMLRELFPPLCERPPPLRECTPDPRTYVRGSVPHPSPARAWGSPERAKKHGGQRAARSARAHEHFRAWPTVCACPEACPSPTRVLPPSPSSIPARRPRSRLRRQHCVRVTSEYANHAELHGQIRVRARRQVNLRHNVRRASYKAS